MAARTATDREVAVARQVYRYRFTAKVPLDQAEETLLLAVYAAEGVHGAARVRLEAGYLLDRKTRTCVVEASTAVRQAELRARKAEVRRAGATLADLRRKLQLTVIRSPVDGVVVKKSANRGEVTQIGQPIYMIVDSSRFWVEANVEETEIRFVQPGRSVVIRVDSYPDREFTGQVTEVGGATVSEFSLFNPQKLTGQFITGKGHGEHHHDPFGHGYGIHTAHSNRFMDAIGFYRWKERVRYRLTGAVPNSWRGEKGKEIMAAALGPDAPELTEGLPALPPTTSAPRSSTAGSAGVRTSPRRGSCSSPRTVRTRPSTSVRPSRPRPPVRDGTS